MSRASIVIGAAVLGLLISLVAVACGGGAEPTATPTTAAVVKTPTPTATLLPGVTPSPVPPTPTPTQVTVAVTPTPSPKTGGILQYNRGTTRPPNLDMHKVTTVGLITNGPGIVYDTLLRQQTLPGMAPGEWVILPQMAEEWSQPDALTYIFKLRQGIRFSPDMGYKDSAFSGVNGREVTADDVVWSLTRQAAPGFINRDLLVKMQSIVAVDKYTVKITLSSPDADFAQAIANAKTVIMAREIADAKGDFTIGPSIGTGPWILKDGGSPDTGYAYVRNPDFFIKGKPYLAGLSQISIRDDQTQAAALRAGQLKYLAVNPPTYRSILSTNPDWSFRFTKTTTVRNGPNWSCIKPPFNNEKVRRAAMYATDPWAIIGSAWDGLGWIGGSIELPDLTWALTETEARTFFADVNKARQLIAESGLQTPITVRGFAANYGESYLAAIQVWQDQLKAIGINITFELKEPATYAATFGVGQYPGDALFFYGPYGGFSTNGFLSAHLREGGQRNSAPTVGCTDQRITQLIDQQFGETDPAKRKQILHDIMTYNYEKGFFIADQSQSITAIRPELHDYLPTGQTYANWHWQEVWLDPQ